MSHFCPSCRGCIGEWVPHAFFFFHLASKGSVPRARPVRPFLAFWVQDPLTCGHRFLIRFIVTFLQPFPLLSLCPPSACLHNPLTSLSNCTADEQTQAVGLQAGLCGSLSVTSGTVTAKVSATGTTSLAIDSSSLAAITASGSSSAAESAGSSLLASASGAAMSMTSMTSMSGSAAAAASMSSASATSKSAGAKLEFGLKGLVAGVVGVVGLVMGGAMVL